MKDLSIIIINFQNPTLTIKCLEHVFLSQSKLNIEIFCIDNGSRDESIQLLEQFLSKQNFKVQLIKLDNNIGFGAANNVAFRKANGKYILLLNSDVFLEPETLTKQFVFMEKKPDVGISTCKLHLPNGQIDPACHRGFPTLWASLTYFSKLEKLFPNSTFFGQYHQGWKLKDPIHEVDAISGAFFWIRNEVLQKVGLFDESFFMYGEDLDLCLRAKNKGVKIMYFANNSCLHQKGQSGRNSNKRITKHQTQAYFWKAMQIFYQKHYAQKYPKILNWIVYSLIKMKYQSYV